MAVSPSSDRVSRSQVSGNAGDRDTVSSDRYFVACSILMKAILQIPLTRPTSEAEWFACMHCFVLVEVARVFEELEGVQYGPREIVLLELYGRIDHRE